MPTPVPPARPAPTTTSGLRAALLAATEPPSAPAAASPAVAPTPVAPSPGAAELLSSSANLQRLCESYHRSHRDAVNRSRRQRIGIGLLVAGVGAAAVYLNRSGTVNATLVTNLILAIAGASTVALAVLGLLWVRDDHRLRSTQGDRLLRALQFNCELPAERLEGLRIGATDPTDAFFDCYAVWKQTHNQRAGGLAGLLAGIGGRGKAAA